jgi:hypothetical protein
MRKKKEPPYPPSVMRTLPSKRELDNSYPTMCFTEEDLKRFGLEEKDKMYRQELEAKKKENQ